MTTSAYNNLLTQATKLDTPIGLESTAQFIFGGQSYVGRPSVQAYSLYHTGGSNKQCYSQ
jgi:hypothetical protein